MTKQSITGVSRVTHGSNLNKKKKKKKKKWNDLWAPHKGTEIEKGLLYGQIKKQANHQNV